MAHVSLKTTSPAKTAETPQTWKKENMIPKSVVKKRRSELKLRGLSVLSLVATICLCWFSENKNLSLEWQTVVFLGAVVLSLVSLILVTCSISDFYTKDSDGLQARTKSFVDTFGIAPDGDRETVQRIVNAVLEGLRRRAQGAFGREIGFQRRHAEAPSPDTVANLNVAKENSKGFKDTFWDAVGTADDWGLTVPTSIDEEIHTS